MIVSLVSFVVVNFVTLNFSFDLKKGLMGIEGQCVCLIIFNSNVSTERNFSPRGLGWTKREEIV